MIRLVDATLTFPDGDGRVTAVDSVSLEVERGTVVGVTGPSGSGKSSLLAVAGLLIRPDSGQVQLDDVDVARLSRTARTDLRREKLGIVFQQSNLLPSLTALEQLMVMGELGGRRRRPPRNRTRSRALELLEAVGLHAEAGKVPAHLSGGERQRVNVARALMNHPTVLLIDEPTSSLDQERGASILDLILRLTAEQNTATLLVTHDRALLARTRRTFTMVDGALAPRAVDLVA